MFVVTNTKDEAGSENQIHHYAAEPVLKTTFVKRLPFETPESAFFSVIHLC